MWLESGLLPRQADPPYCRIHDPGRMARAFDELIAYLDTMPLGKARAVHMLEGLLQLHEQENAPSPGSVHGEAMIRVARRIQAQPQLQWDFRQEAAILAMSYPHFRRLFKRTLHDAPHAFFLKARLAKAVAMLRGGEHSVKEIAYACGFENPPYFSRLFRMHYRTSASEYRRRFLLPS